MKVFGSEQNYNLIKGLLDTAASTTTAAAEGTT
jgi:hypothetical protein